MKPSRMWNARFFIPPALVAALVAAGTLLASPDDGPKLPTDFSHDYLANSML